MLLACYGRAGGECVTPEEFIRRSGPNYREKGIFPYCPGCDERVDPYGVHSTNVTSRFDHQNLDEAIDPLDDCLEANRSGRFRGMHADGWDDERGQRLRDEFFEPDNLKQAYAFCLAICRKGNLTAGQFAELIARADRKSIWAYKDIPLWVIPYVLLTLGNFGAGANARYPFHFVLKKNRSQGLSQIWQTGEHRCSIGKVFSNSGEPVNTLGNPYPINHQYLIDTAGDTGWIETRLLRALSAAGQ
ncbi:hypothetical protein KRR23_03615 [Pseudomonas sp. CVAP|uniref:hypothetical protein n=1 Tax=Pseudomonas sp. CVAP\|nr:hypothetical protein [Pseudomonas sp. CVAP\